MADDLLRERRASGRRAWTGRLIAVDVDEVTLADGRRVTREVVRHPGAVVVVAVTGLGEVLLERQFRYPAGEVLLELPAGTLHPGEDPLACAVRELREETGHLAREWLPLGQFFTAPGFCDEVLHAFLALDVEADAAPTLDDDERIEVLLVPRDELPALVRRGEVRDAKTLASLALAGLLAAPGDAGALPR